MNSLAKIIIVHNVKNGKVIMERNKKYYVADSIKSCENEAKKSKEKDWFDKFEDALDFAKIFK